MEQSEALNLIKLPPVDGAAPANAGNLGGNPAPAANSKSILVVILLLLLHIILILILLKIES